MQRISGVVLTYVHVTDAARSRACVISRVSDRLAGLLLRPGGGHQAAGERDERVRRQLDATNARNRHEEVSRMRTGPARAARTAERVVLGDRGGPALQVTDCGGTAAPTRLSWR